jgi:hypothetical protein
MQKKSFILSLLLILILSFTISCHKEKKYNSKLAFRDLIIEKTGFPIDTRSFSISLDSVDHTEGAFDSDYTWNIKTQFNDTQFEKLKQNIRATKYFKFLQISEANDKEMWAKIDTAKVKGVWITDSIFYKFVEKPTRDGFRAEEFYFSIDTVTKQSRVVLIHL